MANEETRTFDWDDVSAITEDEEPVVYDITFDLNGGTLDGKTGTIVIQAAGRGLHHQLVVGQGTRRDSLGISDSTLRLSF